MLCTIVDETLIPTQGLCARFPNSAAAQGVQSERFMRYVKDRPGHDRRYATDTGKIDLECAFRPRISLQAGLRIAVAFYLERTGRCQPAGNNPRLS